MSEILNRQVASQLKDAARQLEADGADRAYAHAFDLAADSVRHWPISVAIMYTHGGEEGLQEIPGVGPRIARVIRTLLTHRQLPSLSRLRDATGAADAAHKRIPVDELLDVDREYREQAAAGALPLAAPRRFNPTDEAWLPVLHTRRGMRRYTALFSNTENAHRWGHTHDWVVLYVDTDSGEQKQQYTAITARYGAMRGRRVIAGRERECIRAFHKAAA